MFILVGYGKNGMQSFNCTKLDEVQPIVTGFAITDYVVLYVDSKGKSFVEVKV